MNPEEYFSGKTVRVIAGANANGGSYDSFSRFVAATAGHYFPRSTRFDVEYISGAGGYNGLRATLDSNPDGLTIGIVHSRWFQRQAVVGDIPNFDFDEVQLLGSPTFTVAEDPYCVDRSVAASWQEVLDLGRPLRVGTYQPGTEPAIEFMETIGLPFQVVYDYPGTRQIMDAFDRGELDLSNRCGLDLVRALYPEWIEQGRLVPLFYVRKPPDRGYLARLGHTGPLPSFTELPGLNLGEVQRAQLKAVQADLLLREVTRVFILPAGVPDEIRQYWHERFDLIMKDQGFIDTVHNTGYVDWYGYGSTEELLDIIRRVQALDQRVKDILYQISDLSALDRLVQ